jgi:hypothetical protein
LGALAAKADIRRMKGRVNLAGKPGTAHYVTSADARSVAGYQSSGSLQGIDAAVRRLQETGPYAQLRFAPPRRLARRRDRIAEGSGIGSLPLSTQLRTVEVDRANGSFQALQN